MKEFELKPLSSVHLYDGGRCESLDLMEVAAYLKGSLGEAEVDIRDDFLGWHLSSLPLEKREREVVILARELAQSRIHDTGKKEEEREPLPVEIDYERRNLFFKSLGILYDGFSLLKIFLRLIPQSESEHAHIVFTNQLFATWDESDLRFHARVSVYGFPTLISTTGIVEAPAKPTEFYLRRRLGEDPVVLKEAFEGKFIDHEDPRMTEVMKGYALQAVFFYLTGHPFCEDKTCRLYNAHWQEEVIQAQLSGQDLCAKHQAELGRIREERS